MRSGSGGGARPRGRARTADAVLGAHAWAWMRRNPGYRTDWAALAGEPRYEDGDIPLRVQTEADLLAGAEWSKHPAGTVCAVA